MTRECLGCHKILPIDEFYKNTGNNRHPTCKKCYYNTRRKYATSSRTPTPHHEYHVNTVSTDKVKEELLTRFPTNQRTCSSCGILKGLGDFHLSLANPEVVSRDCRLCTRLKEQGRSFYGNL